MARTIEAPALIGVAEPIIMAVDNGATNTRIHLKQGAAYLGTATYPTPPEYETAVTKLGWMGRVLGDGQQINAIGFSVAGQVEDGTIITAGKLKEYGWVGQQFSNDILGVTNTAVEHIAVLNDCAAAANAQMEENRKAGGADTGFVETISTGFGGAGFIVSKSLLIPKEPGHEHLKDGAICGCGREGCVEAHISGSGIESKFGVPGKDLSADNWREVMDDMADAHAQMLERFKKEGFQPEELYLFGSVALKGAGYRGIGVLDDLRLGLIRHRMTGNLSYQPEVLVATHGDDSGIVGAEYAARATLAV